MAGGGGDEQEGAELAHRQREPAEEGDGDVGRPGEREQATVGGERGHGVGLSGASVRRAEPTSKTRETLYAEDSTAGPAPDVIPGRGPRPATDPAGSRRAAR